MSRLDAQIAVPPPPPQNPPPTPPGPSRAGGPSAMSVRRGCLWLVLILLTGTALVQTAVAAGNVPEQWESIARATPPAAGVAAAQAVVGLVVALCAHRLLVGTALWLALVAVAGGSYAALVRWPWVSHADPAVLWTWIPFFTLLALAALDAIPTNLREAAAIDRAGQWFTLRRITLPLAAPLVLGGVVFRTADTFRPVDLRRFLAAHLMLIAGIVAGSLLARWRR